MTKERELIRKTENLIEDLKSICSLNGIGNSPSEYKVISQIFLYKYLNDKFIYETRQTLKQFNDETTTKEVEQYLYNIEPSDYSILTMKLNPNVARIKKEYMVSYLFNNQNTSNPEFYQLFDQALLGIANDNIDIFSVKTGSKEKIRLFDSLSQYITETDKKNTFFKAIINKLVEFSFEDAFKEKYDFFATIFEYLIKDYNKDFGKYAEYYTPNSIARIIAKILAPNPTQNVTLYDPSAGSGTLVLALAHQIGEENCTIYTQDISQKSNEFLRLNLILNNLVHSLGNVIHGDTLVSPAHLNNEKNGLASFDYIVSNPPFKTDFSETRDKLDSEKWKERFFAGVPKIPNTKKDSMSIYLMFIQHIMFSLKAKGKAAIVVPTGFITAKSSIEKNIRKSIVDSKMLTGVISMPSNIFANTGTNVSILFIDKSKQNENPVLIDASKLGTKIKDGKNQKTVLSFTEIENIEDVFLNKKEIDEFCSIPSIDKIISNNYSLSPAQYFKIKSNRQLLSKEEFLTEHDKIVSELEMLLSDSCKMNDKILDDLRNLIYE